MKQISFLFGIITLLLFSGIIQAKETSQELKLWYNKPATAWTEALPIGNGRLGAMIYGGTDKEIIQFNEETLWTGQPHDYSHPGAAQYLDQIRQLLWDGKQKEAEELANKQFMSQPFGQFSYQPFGNILLNFPGHEQATNYRRELNIGNAISSVSYEINGVKYLRELLSSAPDQAIVIRISASKPGAVNFSAGMNTPQKQSTVTTKNGTLILSGKVNNYPKEAGMDGYKYPESKLTFEARLIIENQGGSVSSTDTMLNVSNANSVVIKLVAATSFRNYNDISADPAQRCETYLKAVAGKSYSSIKKAHIADYQKLYSRVSLNLGESELSKRPTDERLFDFYKDNDPALVTLLYQYGRYLFISSSRPGTQPANLQGIWNDQPAPPWDSKYTTNINLEMNYWLAEMTNLSECAEPLFKMCEEMAVTGQKVAKEHYNLPGWILHHNTDIWRGTAPINNANHGIWISGAAWVCQHLWMHYQFAGDQKFLKEEAYPIMKEAARFYAGYLVPDPKHPEWLVSGPSNSPEQGGLVMGPTMDHQIIRDLFANTIDAANVLGVDADFVTHLKDKRARIAPNQIGQYGQLQEWLEDKDDPKSDHRHVSHLWGLHPGSEIHPLTTPELAQACKVTLAERGDGGTGWSKAWKINFWARLCDGDHSYLLLKNLMVPTGKKQGVALNKGGLYDNLFDAHPPFQIDGNFGATSGVTEMLLQSHLRDTNGDYFLDLLPALPSELSHGKITGIRARGGFELSIEWNNGQLSSVEVRSLNGNKMNLRYKGKLISMNTKKGKMYRFTGTNF